MKKQTGFVVIGLLGISAFFLLSFASMAKTDVNTFRKTVEETYVKYTNSLVNEDPELFLSSHAEDVVTMPPGAPAVVGIQALESRIREGIKAESVQEFSIKLDEVEAFGDLGFARGTYTFTATVRASGKTIEYDGKYLTVFKKQADGSWKIYRDCYNSNVSPK